MLFNFFKRIHFLVLILFFFLLSGFSEESKINNNYKLHPGDVLTIVVFDEADMNREVKVSSNGTIIYPLVGEVEVQGFDLLSVTKKLTELLSDFFVAPQVSVYIKQYAKIYVYGEVVRPGAYELSEKLTILQTIAVPALPSEL